MQNNIKIEIQDLEMDVSLTGMSEAVGGLPCGAVWAVIAIYAATN
ncbi:hypothetical protein [Niveispirillum sp. SYP-B3756]|nr:hypothetical protein [Niveispirillum sp. SYP-B3756]